MKITVEIVWPHPWRAHKARAQARFKEKSESPRNKEYWDSRRLGVPLASYAKKLVWTKYPYGWRGMKRREVRALNQSRDDAWELFHSGKRRTATSLLTPQETNELLKHMGAYQPYEEKK